MGVAIALEIARKGGKVVLVLGPGAIEANHPNIHTVRINSAEEMCAGVA
jgi:phosphopantothenoylcysteine synthetase/decarboxylase